MVDLSIIIVNWNTKYLLKKCLSSLFKHTQDAAGTGFSYEVFIVDNGSSDGSPDMVKEAFPSVTLLCNQKNLGFSKANNQAIPLTSGRYILLLNSDTELISDALQKMVSFMDQHPSAGICGTKLLNSDGTRQYSCDTFPRAPLMMFRDKILDRFTRPGEIPWQNRMTQWDFHENFAVDYVIGAVLLIRRETLEQIGMLDEQFFMYAEDIDWCYRAALAGWKTHYLGEVSIYHHNRGSSEQSATLSSQLQHLRAKSLLKFYQKHYGWGSALILQGILLFKHGIKKT